jgi:metal-sulfur cluster biosynthetic enzyme
MTATGPPPVTAERVTEALRSVIDPELGLSVVDLGLVYDVAIRGAEVEVLMTLTTPGCPLHDTMAEWARAAIAALPGVRTVAVRITFDPPWSPEWVGRTPG